MKRNAELILEAIVHSAGHLTAEQIRMALLENGHRMALATVYNNLAQLHSEGRIRKVCVEGYPDRYDRITRHEPVAGRDQAKRPFVGKCEVEEAGVRAVEDPEPRQLPGGFEIRAHRAVGEDRVAEDAERR